MDNENKWEYDYSNLYGSSAGNTGSSNNSGYVNVGSSGTNAANQYDSAASASSSSYNSYSNYTEPTPQPSAPQNHTPKKKKHFNAGKAARSVVALVLAAAMGFVGGYVGSSLNSDSSSKVIVQSVQRDTSALNATSTSTGGSELTLPQVSALVTPSVVVITTEQVVYSTWSWYGQSQVQSGAGSGVIISSDGYVLTCDHVISGASNIIVTIDDVDYTATVVGEDSDSDIAVLKIDATGLTPAVMGDSDALVVGEGAVAVGNPLGELGGTVTNGIISALNRSVSVEGKTMNLIQTNASVSPGNSGGGLFNMAGELIGIVNAKSSDEDAEGLGFAIPINTAMQIAQDLLENGYVTGRPALGVTVLAVTDSSTAQQYGVSTYGVYIVDVTEGGGAANAGLQAGDRIVSIENTEVTANDDLTNVIQEHQVGDTLSIVVARNGQMLTFDVTLGEKNATASTSTQSETDSAENGTESEPDNESGATTESNGDANGSNGSQGGTFPDFGRNAG